MSIEIDPRNYLILQIGENELKLTSSGYVRGDETVKFTIFPEKRTFEEIESIFEKRKDADRMIVMSNDKSNIYEVLKGYKNLYNIRRNYKAVFDREETEDGETIKRYSDLFEVVLEKDSLDYSVNKVEADLDYLSIMTGINLEEEE